MVFIAKTDFFGRLVQLKNQRFILGLLGFGDDIRDIVIGQYINRSFDKRPLLSPDRPGFADAI